MVSCTRCGGRGRLTAHSVPCIQCNGSGEVGPFPEREFRSDREETIDTFGAPAARDAFIAGFTLGHYAHERHHDDIDIADLAKKEWRKYKDE